MTAPDSEQWPPLLVELMSKIEDAMEQPSTWVAIEFDRDIINGQPVIRIDRVSANEGHTRLETIIGATGICLVVGEVLRMQVQS